MGLLDEAIREHLELKRRQGADPGEIARKEKEALAPVLPDEPSSWGADASAVLPEHDPVRPEEAQHVTAPTPAAETTGDAGFSTAGQETAELDMQAMLDADGALDAEAAAAVIPAGSPGAGQVPGAHPEAAPQDAALDWESAHDGAQDDHVIHEIPGQERLSFE